MNVSKTDKRTIAQKLELLDEMIAWFDSDSFELEQAVEKFEEAETLAADIERTLSGIKNQVEIIKKRFDEADI